MYLPTPPVTNLWGCSLTGSQLRIGLLGVIYHTDTSLRPTSSLKPEWHTKSSLEVPAWSLYNLIHD